MKTARDLKDHEDYQPEEAIKYAIAKRKFLLYKEFPSDGEVTDSDSDDDDATDI